MAVVPTWTAGAAPLVKAALTLERSQLFLIYTGTEDFTTEVDEKDEGYFGGGGGGARKLVRGAHCF